MSHGKLDLTGSQVLGWYEIDVRITGRTPAGDPMLDKTQGETVQLARQAAKDAGIAIDKFVGVIVIMNQATGWAQGATGWVASDWRRVDGRNFDGTLGPRARGGGNGIESLGQEVGHGYGLDHSRREGSNDDYLDQWDSMSTIGSAHSTADADYGARGPGLNAWNMRCRGWLDESRIWKPSPNTDFSATIQLRPLHQRNLPGLLGAELPGIGGHSPYLVEFRVPELWDAGIPDAAVLVHRFSGTEESGQTYSPALLGQSMQTHSYILPNQNGQFSFVDGDIFEVGQGPFTRMKVLAIDRNNRLATIQVCYSSAPKTAPVVKVKVSSQGCYPALTEGATARFSPNVIGLKCSQSYAIKWSVTGGTAGGGQPDNQSTFDVVLPDPSTTVVVTVTITLDTGTVVSDSFSFTPITVAEANLRELICRVLQERRKPVPWWEWDPAQIRPVLASYPRQQLSQVIQALEETVQRLKIGSHHG